ncbi:Vinculin [Fragariocoptes setiger]|uniref:Vinculin n=1 Tax=Fragariocoptes setiger TaxID=1670756 RepID=A0ABQ7S837_9ACAR|nr:Vinculin [Fragariocoptes setiger]
MPVFHTKTIEGILEPVASQVSRLVILHEEAEDGNAMPDLSKPVQAVSRAVENLIKVGKDTINSSDDEILRADMPNSLHRVERASRLLEEAAEMLRADPYSQPARKLLIEGSRGILQGTSSLLLCFDESEVRKIIKSCKRILDFMAVVEVIEQMEDLVKFVKDLTPALTKVSRDVHARSRELTHQVHRETLVRCLDQLKTLAPVLICGMKIYVQLRQQGKLYSEAAENRNYLSTRISDEIHEIIRVLQLTTYDEDEWESDNLTAMKRLLGAMTSKMQAAHDWCEDPYAPNGGIGEKSLRQILEHAERIAERALPLDRDAILKSVGDIRAMVNALCELRASGQNATPQAASLSKNIGIQLKELLQLVTRAIANMERSGNLQPAHILSGRMNQAQRWLSNLAFDDNGLGEQAIQAIVDEGRRLALGCQPPIRQQMLDLCNDVESLNKQLGAMCRRDQANTPQARSLARELSNKLHELQAFIQAALVNRVVEDFIDATSALRQFTDAVLAPESVPNREANFHDKARNLSEWSKSASQTARHVATNCAQNKRLAESILASSNQIESMTPQLINSGRIRFEHPDNVTAHENFTHMRDQYENEINRLRNLIDEAIDSASFIRATEEAIRRHTQLCEQAIATQKVQPMIDNASAIARLANRVLMIARQETSNSEDPNFIARVEQATRRLQDVVPTMVRHAKDVAMDIGNPRHQLAWRQANNELIDAVAELGRVVGPSNLPNLSTLNLNKDTTFEQANRYSSIPSRSSGYDSASKASARPTTMTPPPHVIQPSRAPMSAETDDEFEERFPTLQPNQPIMMAAHDLHQEVKQWSSKENEIIAAAKKIALLMARLSQLVRGDSGTKKDLISCAKAIAEASEEVTRLAKEQAKLCTDRKMRTNILQVCERIPTIGTQLRILSTVKATMLGVQGSEEDQEAMEMIVGNAQNLMQSVKETVRACEAASIKIRTDQGVRVRWIRKEPWYT